MAVAVSRVALCALAVVCMSLSGEAFFGLPLEKAARRLKAARDPGQALDYQIKWYEQTLDHFNFGTEPPTYNQRYLVSDKYWAGVDSTGQCLGPIFFYTGNEGDIELFWANTGFVTDTIGPQFKALIVFAEHRYYGESLPFGNQSFTSRNMEWLTSEQALADYAQLIREKLKPDYNAQSCPVIAFGGSYGGMLSAWFRIKYPGVVAGALAASAPVLQFYGTGVSEWAFNQIATQDFTDSSTSCSGKIRQAFTSIQELANTQSGLQQLIAKFQLCQPLKTQADANNLINWIISGLTYMAMTDYPYPSNFLEPMPGYPIVEACQRVVSNRGDVVDALVAGVGVYYNYTGQAGPCNDISNTATPALGTAAWDYQSCTEMVFPISANGTSDMFPVNIFDLAAWTKYCVATYSVVPRPNWITTTYGGRDIGASSNIFFSNGILDPWRGGGFQESVSDTLVAFVMQGAAHHLDLRSPNQQDPSSVKQGRAMEIKHIKQWIDAYNTNGGN